MHLHPRWEIYFVCSFIITVNLLVLSPHIYGFLHQTQTERFSYIAEADIEDIHAYFAWVEQAELGRLTFSDLQTSEESDNFFHPTFLLLGAATHYTHIPTSVIWYSTRVLVNTFLIVVLYLFCKAYSSSQGERLWSFFITVMGSGFGWLIGNKSAELIQPELTIYQSLRWPIIFAIAIALFVLCIWLFFRALEKRSWKLGLACGCLVLMLLLTHIYDVVTLGAVLVGFLVYRVFLAHKGLTKTELYTVMAVALPAIPGIVYYFWFFTHEWVFLMNTQIHLPSLQVWQYFAGFGLLVPLALFGIFRRHAYTKTPELKLLLIWLIVQSLVVFSPFSFQRKLAMGLIIPLGIFAGHGVAHLVAKLKTLPGPFFKTALALWVVGVVIIIASTNLLVTAQDIDRVTATSSDQYIPTETLEALAWLEKDTARQKIQTDPRTILAAYNTSRYIPRFTGLHVYAGHWAQTINLRVKQEQIDYFFEGRMQPEKQRSFLESNNIKNIFFGTEEYLAYGKPVFLKTNPNLFKPIYENQSVTIYGIQ